MSGLIGHVSGHHPPTLLTMPAEIRLAIYELLLVDRSQNILSIRTEDCEAYTARKRRSLQSQKRTSFHVMAGRFRAASKETSYTLLSNPGIYATVLGTNRQIHAEASHVLYGSYIFDFSSDVESVVPFLSDLTPLALSSIKHINLVKRALPYTKESDRYEWRDVCDYVSRNLELQQLGLSIFGGKVPNARYEPTVDAFQKSDFKMIAKFEGMEWVRQLVAIKGLKNLDIKAIWEVCPPPASNALAFFVNFSASIELGFADYLKEHMVAGAA